MVERFLLHVYVYVQL